MLRSSYTLVMDVDRNPLHRLPKPVRFQLMSLLALMWSIIFTAWSGLYAQVGATMAGHVVLLMGVLFTAGVFRWADRQTALDHRRAYRDPQDGCTRYDDIWGG